jgi:hypothetical protein
MSRQPLWQRATLLEEGEVRQSLFAVLRQRLAAAELEFTGRLPARLRL